MNRFFVEAGGSPSRAPAVAVSISDDPESHGLAVWLPDSAPGWIGGAWK